MNTKQFDLSVILSVTTGKLLTDMDNLYEILRFLTGKIVFTHQIPKILPMASEHILKTYPELSVILLPDGSITKNQHAKWLIAEQKTKYGAALPLTPMPKST